MISAEETDQQVAHLRIQCSQNHLLGCSKMIYLSNLYVNQHSVSDFSKVQTWTCSLGTEEKTNSGGEQTDADKMMSSMGSQHARIHLQCTSLHQTAMMLKGIRQVAMNQSDLWMTEPAESAEHDLDMEDNPVTDISRQMQYDTKGVKKNQSSSNFLWPHWTGKSIQTLYKISFWNALR